MLIEPCNVMLRVSLLMVNLIPAVCANNSGIDDYRRYLTTGYTNDIFNVINDTMDSGASTTTPFSPSDMAMDVNYTSAMPVEVATVLKNFGNISETNNTDSTTVGSSFNLAIIPALAVLIFIVVLCLKCCTWFRNYTRGNHRKDTAYAVILKDGDEEYDPVDMLSESNSTACYDTVSSYCSFLKRSGNDSTLNSIRALRSQHFKDVQSPNKELWRRLMRADARRHLNSDVEKSPEMCFEREIVSKNSKGTAIRMSSTSSEETTSELLSDSPDYKRSNRFRVSFVTESTAACQVSPTSSQTGSCGSSHCVQNSDNGKRVTLKPLVKTTTVSMASEMQVANRHKKGLVEMVDKGTQTNKSFRYSLRKSKRHKSESDANLRNIAQIHHTFSEKTKENNLDGGYQSEQVVCDSSSGSYTSAPPSYNSNVIHSSMKDLCGTAFNPNENDHKLLKYPLELEVRLKQTDANDISHNEVQDINRIKHNDQQKSEQRQGLLHETDDDVFERDETPPGVQYMNNLYLRDSWRCNNEKSIHNAKDCYHSSKSDGDIYKLYRGHRFTSLLHCNKCEKTDSVTKQDVMVRQCQKCNRSHPGETRVKDMTLLTHTSENNSHRNSDQCLDKRNSIISLESSGYAELSSSESVC